MDKEQIEEIRTRYDIAGSAVQYAYHIIPDAIRLSRADMPDLLDALEEAQEQNDRFQAMIVRMAKSGGRLRQALQALYANSTHLSTYKGVTSVVCYVCNTIGVESKGHAGDCPFKLLEVENGATKD